MKKTAIIRALCVVVRFDYCRPGSVLLKLPVRHPKRGTRERRWNSESRREDTSAFVEAADAHRKDLIPLIEKVSDSKVGKMALAKLGVRKYLDEIVTELTTSISVAVTSGGRNACPPELRSACRFQ